MIIFILHVISIAMDTWREIDSRGRGAAGKMIRMPMQ